MRGLLPPEDDVRGEGPRRYTCMSCQRPFNTHRLVARKCDDCLAAAPPRYPIGPMPTPPKIRTPADDEEDELADPKRPSGIARKRCGSCAWSGAKVPGSFTGYLCQLKANVCQPADAAKLHKPRGT